MERNGKVECRDPDAVEYLAKLPAGDVKLHPPVIRSREGGYTAYWRDGEEVRWREITAGELPEFGRNPSAPSAGLDAILGDAETRFSELMPKLLKAAAQPGGDMDSIELALRDGCLGSGAPASGRFSSMWMRALRHPSARVAAGGWRGTAGRRRHSRRGSATSRWSARISVAGTAAAGFASSTA